jgi:2-keto-3-deoxy-L-rhamnonate aldolase RhmA
MIRNLALDSMRAGETALGVVIRHERGPHIARAMRASGFDWLFLDLEHSAMPLDAVAAISTASLDAGITPIVRVPAMDLGTAIRALDTGALGVLMPHVETAAEAQAIARAFRYPPLGHRSISSTLPQFHFQSPPAEEACRTLDAATLVGVMLETPAAVENAEAIAAVPGIDLLFIGAVDLAAEAGLHGHADHPILAAMFQKVVRAASRHGKLVGIGGIADDALLARCQAMGMRMVLLGTDLGFMMAAASARTRSLRAALGRSGDGPMGDPRARRD